MHKPDNKHYVVAVNSDIDVEMYPLRRESHLKKDVTDPGDPPISIDKLHPEVQRGYLTTAEVMPDGVIIPAGILSLTELEIYWEDLEPYTWEQIGERYVW